MIKKGINPFGLAGLLVLLITAPAVPRNAGPSASATDAEAPIDEPVLKGEISGLVDLYLTALAERDELALRTLYVEDKRFIWLEDGRFQYQTADDVIASLASFPPDTAIATEVSAVEVSGVGSRGALASMEFATQVGSGERSFRFTGVLTLVLERSDGQWSIVGGHSSTPRTSAGEE